jgi:lysozyme
MGWYEDKLALEQELATRQATFDREQAESQAARAARDTAKAALDAFMLTGVKGGPDLSEFNPGVLDWAATRAAGYELAIHRISDGDKLDARMQTAAAGQAVFAAIRAAGLVAGSYYLCRVGHPVNNGNRNGKSEAAMAIYFAESRGAVRQGDLPMALDFETLNEQTPQKAARHVMDWIGTYAYVKGTPPILYTNPGTWQQVEPHFSAQDRATLATCPLWQAEYGVAAPRAMVPWVTWTMWQYTDVGTAPGIPDTSIDMNRFNGDRTALDSLRIAPA